MTSNAGALSSARAATIAPRSRRLAFWIATLIIIWELAMGGAWDILRIPYVVDVVVVDLGYPEYFLVILGIWKVLGAAALLTPRWPRLREWAYAGAFFNYTGAVASHIAVGDGFSAWVGPAGYAAILMVSWALRSPAGSAGRPTRPVQPDPVLAGGRHMNSGRSHVAVSIRHVSVGQSGPIRQAREVSHP